MKLPSSLRGIARKVTGSGAAQPIAPAELAALAKHESVLMISVGMLRPGAANPALPGEQRGATLATVADVVANEPRDRPIVLHCG